MNQNSPRESCWRSKVHEIIFEADTTAGKAFDVILIISIALSIVVILLESVSHIRMRHAVWLSTIDWIFTILFTIEYILRFMSVRRPLLYAKSFYGLVDLFAILPSYLSLLVPGTGYLRIIRILRVLRIFRVFKLVQYVHEAQTLVRALYSSRRKIIVFVVAVLTLVMIFGCIMYIVEGEANGFTSIPRSMYWAVVTLTTVGYGDISPKTSLGQTLAAIIMILGYAIIAVPTGIVTAEMVRAEVKPVTTQSCPTCSAEGHDANAVFCKYCGSKLN
ncbi:ion transporter [candidate division KSB1 bacterium]|nr:ion transporter [candidate division KSB1 bacterium]RQW02765.1 MAG: ion transporter [candidate division KSB1 bacterium]